jgi:hypothetical protein
MASAKSPLSIMYTEMAQQFPSWVYNDTQPDFMKQLSDWNQIKSQEQTYDMNKQTQEGKDLTLRDAYDAEHFQDEAKSIWAEDIPEADKYKKLKDAAGGYGDIAGMKSIDDTLYNQEQRKVQDQKSKFDIAKMLGENVDRKTGADYAKRQLADQYPELGGIDGFGPKKKGTGPGGMTKAEAAKWAAGKVYFNELGQSTVVTTPEAALAAKNAGYVYTENSKKKTELTPDEKADKKVKEGEAELRAMGRAAEARGKVNMNTAPESAFSLPGSVADIINFFAPKKPQQASPNVVKGLAIKNR